MISKLILLTIGVCLAWSGWNMMQQPEFFEGIVGLYLFVVSIFGSLIVLFQKK